MVVNRLPLRTGSLFTESSPQKILYNTRTPDLPINGIKRHYQNCALGQLLLSNFNVNWFKWSLPDEESSDFINKIGALGWVQNNTVGVQ